MQCLTSKAGAAGLCTLDPSAVGTWPLPPCSGTGMEASWDVLGNSRKVQLLRNSSLSLPRKRILQRSLSRA